MDEGNAPGLFDSVASGQPVVISAQVWNLMLKAAIANEYGDRQKTGSQPRGRSPGIIRIRNDSGAAVDRFGVLGLNGPLILPADNLDEYKRVVAFSGVTPVVGTHEGKFAVLQEPLAIGGIGAAMVSGVTPVQLTVSGSLLAFAEIAATSATLQNLATGSARVLSADPSGSPRNATVRIGEGGATSSATLKLRGTLAGTLSFGSTATMNIAGGGTVTVHDWLLSSGQSIASGKQVTAFLDANGSYYVDGAQCS